MAALTIGEVRAAAREERTRTAKSDRAILKEASAVVGRRDIFLSHSFRDRELIIGTRRTLIKAGLSVYVDWIDDADLDREAVDEERASGLRDRMRECDTLFYAHTPSAKLSRWCPWELGYFDALHHPDRQVFVLPVLDAGEDYDGQEYLSLYPVVDLSTYRHEPRRVREAREFEAEMFHSAMGVRRSPRDPARS